MKEFTTIIRPSITEKSSVLQTQGLYTFLVKRESTKVDIKKAVEAIYGKKVKSVQTMIRPAKTRLARKGVKMTKRSVQKYAVVSLKDNQTIDLNKIKDTKTK